MPKHRTTHKLREASVMVMLSVTLYCHAQTTDVDTMTYLKDIEVTYRPAAQGITVDSEGNIMISALGQALGMRTLGQADVLRSATMLPGISTTSDYSGGMSIRGNDYTHSAYTLDGARVWYPYRFGGIFSDFNTNHIGSLRIPSHAEASAPLCLGGNVVVSTPDDASAHWSGIVDVGILSSSLTLDSPLSQSTSLRVSGRTSYINTLYNNAINDAHRSIKYGFEDINLTFITAATENSAIKASAYYSGDRLKMDDQAFTLDNTLLWHNAGASVTYRRYGKRTRLRMGTSTSGLWSALNMKMPQLAIDMPSSIWQTSAYGTVSTTDDKWEYGYRAEYYHICPISSQVTGTLTGDTGSSSGKITADAITADIDAAHTARIGDNERIKTLVRLSGINNGKYRHITPDISATYSHITATGVLTATISSATQYLHHVGMSDIGLASNFWLASTTGLWPQRSIGADATYQRRLGKKWSATAKIHGQRVLHATEYFGDLLSILTRDFTPYQAVRRANGYNAGADLTAHYSSGQWTGWAGYALNISRRHWAEGWGWGMSAPLHSVKAHATWHASRAIDISAYFTAASGRPYTPVRGVFIIAGNVLTEYGPHNSARLPWYHRLDLSATCRLRPWKIGRTTAQSFVNISLINAYGHRNVEMQYFTYDYNLQTVYLHRVSSLYRYLPSISCTVKF